MRQMRIRHNNKLQTTNRTVMMNRTIPLLCMILLFPACVFAQDRKLTAAEYFWDTDPGQGSGMAMTVADGDFDEAIENVLANTALLPAEGSHKLGTRLKDVANIWSPVFYVMIFIDESVTDQREINITAGEYFWDTDPG